MANKIDTRGKRQQVYEEARSAHPERGPEMMVTRRWMTKFGSIPNGLKWKNLRGKFPLNLGRSSSSQSPLRQEVAFANTVTAPS